jgi:D-alanyl-D-alanine carboxypeptidase (penicillin-binding protein 5/6)
MRRLAHFCVVLFLLSSVPLASFAADKAKTPPITQPATAKPAKNAWASYLVPAAPAIDAKSYVLMDVQSGKVLAQKKANIKMPPASLTKLMTLYIVFKELASGRINLTDKVTISKVAWKTGGSRMFVKLGNQVSVQNLIQGVIVDSGNDATMALAEFVGSTVPTFTQMMNQQAKILGMTESHFSDPTGLPMPDHLTTAHDLSLLARATIMQFPQYYHFFGEKWLTWNKIRQPNRNRLLWRSIGVDGMKTGHTAAAGFCQISSGIQHGTRLLSVVMGTPTDMARADESQKILSYGFRFFQSAQIYKADEVISQQRVWKGEDKNVALGVAKDFYVTIPHSAYADLKVGLTIDSKIMAPITKGQQLGEITVSLKGNAVATAELVALKADPAGGWFTRFIDAIAHFFHNLFHGSKTQQVVVGGEKTS